MTEAGTNVDESF